MIRRFRKVWYSRRQPCPDRLRREWGNTEFVWIAWREIKIILLEPDHSPLYFVKGKK